MQERTKPAAESRQAEPIVFNRPRQLVLALVLVLFLIDIRIPLGVAAGVPYVLAVLLTSNLLSSRCTVRVGVLSSILVVIGLLLSPSGGLMWMVLANRALALLAIWSVALVSIRRNSVHDSLEEMKEELEQALSGGDLGTWRWNVQTGEVQFNERWAAMLGYSLDQINPNVDSWAELLHPEDKPRVMAALTDYLEGRTDRYEAVQRLRMADGGWCWILDKGKIIEYDREGKPLRMSGTHLDVNALKRAERELDESRSHLQGVLDAALETAIIATDRHGIINLFSRGAERMLGYSAAELVGRQTPSIWHDPAQIHERAQELSSESCQEVWGFGVFVFKAIQNGSDTREWTYVHKNGVRFTVRLTVSVIKDSDGNRIGFLGVAHDITDRMRIEQEKEDALEKMKQSMQRVSEVAAQLESKNRELDRARQQAESATRARSDFLANMSHEIRTPMNGLVGMLDLLKGTQLDDEQVDFAKTASASAESLLTIINDILDFSKIESGKLELEEIPFDLREVIEGSTELLAAKCQEKQLELLQQIEPGMPVLLLGDPGRLRQVLLNLIGNALKFTSEGEIVVSAGVVKERDGQAMLRFEVRDTGIGIEPEIQPLLFDSFTQADTSTTRNFGGTGLGLAICRQLTSLMGGEIGVISEPGKGSIFWFTVRLKIDDNPARDQSWTAAELKGRRVLVVDNNHTNLRILEQQLRYFGMDVVLTDSSLGAEDLIEDARVAGRPFDIAILDQVMPELEGSRLATRIRANQEFAGLRLVLLTSAGRRGDARRMAEIGIDGYLVKPVRNSLLGRCLQMVLSEGCRGNAEDGKRNLVTRHSVKEAERRSVRILLVEDNRVNQKVAINLITRAGFSVELAENGQEALDMLQLSSYDLLLMDCQMPVMDGFEATRRIRELKGSRATVPIVAMTANAMEGDRQRCLDCGMDDYLSKPIKPDLLVEMINRYGIAEQPTVQQHSAEVLSKVSEA